MKFWCNINIVSLSQTSRSEVSKTMTSLLLAEFCCCLAETLHKLYWLYLKVFKNSKSMHTFKNWFIGTNSRSSTSQGTSDCFLEIQTVSMLNGLLLFFTTPSYTALFLSLYRFVSVSSKQNIFTLYFCRRWSTVISH